MNASPTHNCRCWPVVLGTLLITFGVANVLLGIASTAASVKLADIAVQVEGGSEAIRIGRTFRSISGGLLSIADDGTGAAAEDILKSLPAPWLTGVLGVLRIVVASAGIMLGAMLVRRRTRVLPRLVQWTVVCFALGLICIWFVGLPIATLIGGVGGYSILGIDAALHLVWPAIVFARIRDTIRTGEGLEC